AVAHDLVEAKAQLRGSAADGMDEFRVEKRLSSRKSKRGNAMCVSVFQETQGSANIEAVRPFNRYAAMRAAEIALKSPRKRQVIRPKRACPPLHRSRVTSGQCGLRAVRRHDDVFRKGLFH